MYNLNTLNAAQATIDAIRNAFVESTGKIVASSDKEHMDTKWLLMCENDGWIFRQIDNNRCGMGGHFPTRFDAVRHAVQFHNVWYIQ